jgi:hypothetical protein
MKWRRWLEGLMSTAALLLPLAAVPESRIQTAPAGAAASATAHVNFKIVIPQVLYLHVGGENARTADGQAVTVMSNGRNVTLKATFPRLDSTMAASGSIVLHVSGRKVIVQDAQCAPASDPVVAAPAEARDLANKSHRYVCTASMP